MGIAISLAEALREVHRQGRVYGQLQPRGVALVEGAVRLIPAVPTVAATPYSSPEQAAGQDLDRRSDIFSLGAVMYEMFSGRPAFRATNRAAVGIASGRPAGQSEVTPPAIAALIARCLERKRERRIQRMEIVLAELKLQLALAPADGDGKNQTAGEPRARLDVACPHCCVRDVHASPAQGRLEALLGRLGVRAGRCYRCYRRFLWLAGIAFPRDTRS